MLKNILKRGIKPYATQIAPIVIAGDVAVVVYEPSKEGKEAALAIGWDGVSPVFKMEDATKARFANNLDEMGDHVAGRWLRANRAGRIFLIANHGTLLVNFDPSNGWSIEPGSLNRGSA